MFCPHCGANLADDAKFCGSCGNQLTGAAPQAEGSYNQESQVLHTGPSVAVADPPVYTAPITMPVDGTAGAKPEGKSQFIKNHGTPGVKVMTWVSWLACILCAVMLAASAIYTVTCPIVKMPIMEMVAEMDESIEQDLEQLEDSLDEAALYMDDFEEMYEEEKSALSREQQEIVEGFMELKDDLDSDLSVLTLFKAVDRVEELVNENLDDEFEIVDTEGLDEVKAVYRAIVTVAILCIGFITLLLLLAAWRKLNTVTILTMFITLPVVFVLGGVTVVMVTFALYIAAIVAHIVINQAYRNYRKAVRGDM